MSCDLFLSSHTHRTIQERVSHPKTNDENFSLCVGNDGSYFCAKSPPDFKPVWTYTLIPLLQKIRTTSEKVTIKVGIDLDRTIVRIDGTIYPSTIRDTAMTRNGIPLDFKSSDRFDNVSIIFLVIFVSQFFTFHKQFLSQLLKIHIWLFTLLPLLEPSCY